MAEFPLYFRGMRVGTAQIFVTETSLVAEEAKQILASGTTTNFSISYEDGKPQVAKITTRRLAIEAAQLRSQNEPKVGKCFRWNITGDATAWIEILRCAGNDLIAFRVVKDKGNVEIHESYILYRGSYDYQFKEISKQKFTNEVTNALAKVWPWRIETQSITDCVSVRCRHWPFREQ
jgi:hypothetical protein